MIQINQIKLQIPHTEEKLRQKITKQLRIRDNELISYRILKKSLDARKKPQLFYIYNVEAEVKQEHTVKKRVKDKNVTFRKSIPSYDCQPTGTDVLHHRPVVIGTGPAGLFCGYELAKKGYKPILLERGADVDERIRDVENFWNGAKLKTNSNVQFGEGGAGTFSDGKLNTVVNDTFGRNQEVLRVFVEHGAPEAILYDSKPHIGTDILANVVKSMREEIIRMGGEVLFHTQVTDISCMGSAASMKNPSSGDCPVDNHCAACGAESHRRQLSALTIQNTLTGEISSIDTDIAVLAIGHSARDTFSMLLERNVHMEPKSFAVGVRMEHPQNMINASQYGNGAPEELPAAPYKLTANLENGRGVYTFCMCPGGYVVNASSEENRLAVNGMSYSGRDGVNANSAVIVTVTPEDYGSEDVLSGMEFQRRLEETAYREGQSSVPVQLFEDFCNHVPSKGPGEVLPQIKGSYRWADVRNIFPEEIAASLEEGIKSFDRKIHGYARGDAVVSGVESRTSSPVRILRDVSLECNVGGLYPCGEGAGYAGGITSAAMDGLKVAETVMKTYRPFDTVTKG